MSDSPESYTNVENKGGSTWQLPAIAVLALVALGGLFFGWSNSAKVDAAKQAMTDQLKAAQQAEQQAVENESSLAAQAQENELQMTQIRANAEIEKVKITQEGGLQKELTKAGAQPGSQFPETVAPPTLEGAGPSLPGIPN